MCVFSWRRAGGVGGTWGIRVSFAGNVKEAHQRLRSSAAATRVVVCVYDGSLARRAAAAPRKGVWTPNAQRAWSELDIIVVFLARGRPVHCPSYSSLCFGIGA